MQEFVAVIFQRILQVSCKNLVNTIFKIQASICQDQTGKILTIDFQESCHFQSKIYARVCGSYLSKNLTGFLQESC